MDEEKMWKGFYDKLQEINMNPPTEHDSKLQDSDGGFFEKFGSLLRQKSHYDEQTLKTSLAPFAEEDEEEATAAENKHENVVDDNDDSGIIDNETFTSSAMTVTSAMESHEQLEQDVDVDDAREDDFVRDINKKNKILDRTFSKSLDNLDEIQERNEEFIEKAFGMNIEDLYEEIIYEIQNNIGCVDGIEICSNELIEFAQDAFKIPDDKHNEIVNIVDKKEPPKIRLNVEVIKAENLMPKDSNGLSDPFVTLYLESNSSHRYNSSVKAATLNPIWEEHFSLPINENPRNEVLIIEVWDFDAAETVKDKVNKVFDVKGIKGLRTLIKEIAVTASTGKHDNELIGRTAITLKSVPVSGLTVWYNLEKGAKTKSRGSLLVNLTLSAEKNKQVAIQEHRHLLKLLLMHELESSKVAHYWWNGKFDVKAETIRSQHAVQSGLTNFDCALSQWSVYANIHENHPLNFTLFNNILETLIPVLKCMGPDCEERKTFWDGVKRILPSCFSIIRKIRAKNVSDKHIVKTLIDVLDILQKIKLIDMCSEIELFPKNIYGWLTKIDKQQQHNNDDENNTDNVVAYNIDNVLIDAINSGAKEWLEHIIDGSKPAKKDEINDEDHLQYLIRVIQLIRSDLQRAMEFFDKHFYYKIKLNFSTLLYKFYEEKLSEIAEPIVTEVCSHIKRLNVPSDDGFEQLPEINTANMGTTLFELYLVLKRFLTLGKSLYPNTELDIENYHMWFMPGVSHWLDISVIKALNRIDKAIDLDQLIAVDETVKYSSSAVDTLAIYYQIKIFWQQLDWPDIEGSYMFVAKIVDDICRCCVFYAQRMSRRVERSTQMHYDNSNNDLFHVSPEWCLAINNIDYIRQSLPAFIKELGTDDIIKKLGEFRSNLEADRCSVTIKNVIENALDIEKNQILELIDIVARKMTPPIKRFLAEGAEVLHEDSNSMEKLMMYLEESLGTLYETLNEVNFARILDAIWTELSVIMYDLIQANLDKRRPPAFFQNLRHTLNVMISCFKAGKITTSDVDVLSEIQRILDLHAFETADLIHQYYLERLGNQKELTKSEYGQLTIKATFNESGFMLTILNARNLVPMDTGGSCDSFVKALFLPTNRFNGITNVKTAVHNKNRFPLYDEEYRIFLSDEQKSKQNSLILFSIKDKDLFGNQYIAECYVTFADLLANENEQIHLELSRPEYTDSDTIKALEFRQGDKQAKDFLKKLKNKSYS